MLLFELSLDQVDQTSNPAFARGWVCCSDRTPFSSSGEGNPQLLPGSLTGSCPWPERLTRLLLSQSAQQPTSDRYDMYDCGIFEETSAMLAEVPDASVTAPMDGDFRTLPDNAFRSLYSKFDRWSSERF